MVSCWLQIVGRGTNTKKYVCASNAIGWLNYEGTGKMSKSRLWPLRARQTNYGDVHHLLKDLSQKHLVINVVGGKKKGKTATCFSLMDGISQRGENKECYVMNWPQESNDRLPSHVENYTGEIYDVPKDSVVIIDELALAANSRRAMSNDNVELGQVLAILAHKQITLITNVQNTYMGDVNMSRMADVNICKPPGLNMIETERGVIADLYKSVEDTWESLKWGKIEWQNKDWRAYSYIQHERFRGFVETQLPAYWDDDMSRAQESWTTGEDKETFWDDGE